MTHAWLLVVALAWATGSGEAKKGVINPHNQPDACLTCHEPQADGVTAGEPKPSGPLCLSCHPTADMHPVGVTPDKVKVPAGWPLEDGKVECATCHAEPACDPKHRTAEPPYHRGGNVEPVIEFCYRCHERATYTRDDPHHPKEARGPRDGTCSVCHTQVPAEGAALADSRLRLKAEKVCTECHRAPVHAGISGHLGEKVSPERAAGLPATVTLDEGNRITCFSCHEVHGEAVVETGTAGKLARGLRERARTEDWTDALPAQPIWPGETTEAGHPPLLAASVADGSLCAACHGEGP